MLPEMIKKVLFESAQFKQDLNADIYFVFTIHVLVARHVPVEGLAPEIPGGQIDLAPDLSGLLCRGGWGLAPFALPSGP